MSHRESPKEHYDSSGHTLIMIGSALMLIALVMLAIEYYNPESTSKHDHISNALIGLLTIFTGIWLRSHTEEDLSS